MHGSPRAIGESPVPSQSKLVIKRKTSPSWGTRKTRLQLCDAAWESPSQEIRHQKAVLRLRIVLLRRAGVRAPRLHLLRRRVLRPRLQHHLHPRRRLQTRILSPRRINPRTLYYAEVRRLGKRRRIRSRQRLLSRQQKKTAQRPWRIVEQVLRSLLPECN